MDTWVPRTKWRQLILSLCSWGIKCTDKPYRNDNSSKPIVRVARGSKWAWGGLRRVQPSSDPELAVCPQPIKRPGAMSFPIWTRRGAEALYSRNARKTRIMMKFSKFNYNEDINIDWLDRGRGDFFYRLYRVASPPGYSKVCPCSLRVLYGSDMSPLAR